MELNDISGAIIAAALKVHSEIGPGVLESVYQTCVHHELRKLGFEIQAEVALPVLYQGLRLESGFRIDLLVANRVIVEIHKAQLLTYLRLANKPLGLLLNFNVVHMREGIRRVLNNRYRPAQAAGHV